MVHDLQDELNAGLELHKAGRLAEAVGIYEKILNANPDHAEALHLSGLAAHHGGRNDEAVKFATRAVSLDPGNSKYITNLGSFYMALGQEDAARTSYRDALEIDPESINALFNLGVIYTSDENWDAAVELFRRAIALEPAFADAHYNLGLTLAKTGQVKEAIASYRSSIAINPVHGDCQNNLGVLLRDRGNLEASVDCFRKALDVKPDYAEAHCNLGNALSDLGDLDEALACYKKAVELEPGFSAPQNNYLHTLLYLPEVSNQHLFDTSCQFVKARHESRIESDQRPNIELASDERLRIGYLSSDFYNHPIGDNVTPLLCNHDHQKFEIFCYSEMSKKDDVTDMLRGHADHWRTVTGLSDAAVAKCIEDDGIHIMVYLGGNFDANRPFVATYRPAPVQVSMYSGTTTAVEGMDFWLTDRILHPEGSGELFTEELVYLPNFYAYPELQDTPPVASLPADDNDFITFASFNKPRKMNDKVLDLWSQVLLEVANSRLILKFGNFLESPLLSQKILGRLAHNAVARDRITLISTEDSFHDHLACYNQADIALDTFPFAGATTTFQALWMGVPVISLMGERFIARMGGSISYHAGLPSLAAETPQEFVEQAVSLAGQRSELRKLRSTMRQRLLSSSLCDGPAYARHLEQAYCSLWNARTGKG
jgi:protein O-GlcNAc transferase